MALDSCPTATPLRTPYSWAPRTPKARTITDPVRTVVTCSHWVTVADPHTDRGVVAAYTAMEGCAPRCSDTWWSMVLSDGDYIRDGVEHDSSLVSDSLPLGSDLQTCFISREQHFRKVLDGRDMVILARPATGLVCSLLTNSLTALECRTVILAVPLEITLHRA